ncbi:MAG: hypothetical protein OWS74_06990 [Firmicutes bacterium]|nr:hypothetical protein [Bacillota bacterium]
MSYPNHHHSHRRHDAMGDGGLCSHQRAQTFRRGRVLEFLQRLDIKRNTLICQLKQPELQTIHPVLSGELKAIETVRNEFIALFNLCETETLEADASEKKSAHCPDREEP